MTERKCAWCQVINWRDPLARDLASVVTSHGICDACFGKICATIRRSTLPDDVEGPSRAIAASDESDEVAS